MKKCIEHSNIYIYSWRYPGDGICVTLSLIPRCVTVYPHLYRKTQVVANIFSFLSLSFFFFTIVPSLHLHISCSFARCINDYVGQGRRLCIQLAQMLVVEPHSFNCSLLYSRLYNRLAFFYNFLQLRSIDTIDSHDPYRT